MSLSGKSTTSIRKTDLLSQKEPALSFKKLVFAHKATVGDLSINLSSLSLPSELVDFVQPTLSELQAITNLQLKKNLHLQSSARGPLMHGLSYTVGGNGSINFTDSFGPALDGEIFIGSLDSIPRTGTLVADIDFISETGTLAANTTDITLGKSFKVNMNPSKQLGAVEVIIEGQDLLRNVGNATAAPSADGNYQEVDSGNGYSVLIRLNESQPVARSYKVRSTGMAAIKPDGSFQDELEALQATTDLLVDYVASIADVPETTFQAAPTQVQLRQFGDRLVQAELDIDSLQPLLDPTLMSDALATKQGHKAYFHGTTYNSGIAPTVTGTGFTNVRSEFIPYQMQDGSWRMRFNVSGTRTTGSSIGSYNVSINGVTFKNVSGFNQALSFKTSNLVNDRDVGHAYALPNASTIHADFASNDISAAHWSGDVELNAKPTWAY